MTDKEIVARFLILKANKKIADTLESIVNQQNMIIDYAIKILLEESIAKGKELPASLDGQIEDFMKEALKK